MSVNNQTKVRKAVIPAAGLGTRFLPATKSIPKELLPIVDAPILLYVVEEILDAGIEDIIFISGRGKSAIEDFFDVSFELEHALERTGKTQFLERVQNVRKNINFISIRQREALGLGHAVLTAAPVVGNEPFAVLLGDEIMIGKPGPTRQLIECYQSTGHSVVGVMEVEPKEVCKYGVVDPLPTKTPGLMTVRNMVEKPAADQSPSRWAVPGRYVFSPEIFDHLKNVKPGKNGEIQLTDAIAALAREGKMMGSTFQARRYDAGDKLGFLQANIEVALAHEDLKVDFKKYLKTLVQGWE